MSKRGYTEYSKIFRELQIEELIYEIEKHRSHYYITLCIDMCRYSLKGGLLDNKFRTIAFSVDFYRKPISNVDKKGVFKQVYSRWRDIHIEVPDPEKYAIKTVSQFIKEFVNSDIYKLIYDQYKNIPRYLRIIKFTDDILSDKLEKSLLKLISFDKSINYSDTYSCEVFIEKYDKDPVNDIEAMHSKVVESRYVDFDITLRTLPMDNQAIENAIIKKAKEELYTTFHEFSVKSFIRTHHNFKAVKD